MWINVVLQTIPRFHAGCSSLGGSVHEIRRVWSRRPRIRADGPHFGNLELRFQLGFEQNGQRVQGRYLAIVQHQQYVIHIKLQQIMAITTFLTTPFHRVISWLQERTIGTTDQQWEMDCWGTQPEGIRSSFSWRFSRGYRHWVESVSILCQQWRIGETHRIDSFR